MKGNSRWNFLYIFEKRHRTEDKAEKDISNEIHIE